MRFTSMSLTPMSLNSNAIRRALIISAAAISLSTAASAAETPPAPAKPDAAAAKPAAKNGWDLAKEFAAATTPEAKQAALDALVAAADKGDAGALYTLGDIYQIGRAHV